MSTRWAILILFLAGLLAYGNTAKNGLFWDDDEFITHNAYIRSFRYLPQWFSQPLTAGAGVNSNYYRPLLQLSFTIDYKLWGLWPAGYHLENLLWHTTAAILLYFFLKDLLLKFSIQYSVFSISAPAAFATALLWLVHPIQVEAVAYANSRGDSMATVFILLSLILWMKNKIKGSAVAFVLALLSKEFAIITPGLMALISFVNLTSGKFTKLPTAKLPVWTKSLLIMFSIAAVYIVLRLTALNFQNTLNFYGADQSTNKNCDTQPQQRLDLCLYSTSIFIRSLTFLKVLPIYFKLLVWPANLHMERTIDIPTTFLDSSILLSLSFILILVGFFGWALIFSLRKSAGTSEPRNRALVTHGRRPWEQVSVVWGAIGWFFISILPVSGIIPISQILAEHFLYLPSIGFFLMVSWLMVLGLNQVSRFLTIKRLNDSNHLTFTYLIYWTILLIISILLISKTIRQNRVWRDPIIFYEYTLAHAKPTARVYNNLAMAYAETRNPQKAISNYNKAISLGDVYPNPHYNLGNTYVEIGETEKAEDEYKKALKIDPGFHYATVKLGQIYINQGKIDAAKNLVCPAFPAQPLCL